MDDNLKNVRLSSDSDGNAYFKNLYLTENVEIH